MHRAAHMLHRAQQSRAARTAQAVKSYQAQVGKLPTHYAEVELTEHLCLAAFRAGRATGDHWNHLAECRNVLIFGAGHCRETARKAGEDASEYQAVMDLCNRAKTAMLAVKDREQRTGKMGLNAEEMEIIAAVIMTSGEFWPLQPQWVFAACVRAVRKLTCTIVQPKGN